MDRRAQNLPHAPQLTGLYDKLSFGPVYNKDHHLLRLPQQDFKFTEITHRLLYQTLLQNSPVYKEHHHRAKWYELIHLPLDWDQIWPLVHSPILLAHTKTAIWEQLHLNFYTQYTYNRWHHMADVCPFCHVLPPNILHIVYDCPFVRTLWTDLEPILEAVHPTPLILFEKCFGIIGTSPSVQLRNFLTFIFRECILLYERIAYHNQQGLLNLKPFKRFYNNKVARCIQHWFYYYDFTHRSHTFRTYFEFTDALTIRLDDGRLQIIDPYQIEDD